MSDPAMPPSEPILDREPSRGLEEHLRELPDGSLSAAEVAWLLDALVVEREETERLRATQAAAVHAVDERYALESRIAAAEADVVRLTRELDEARAEEQRVRDLMRESDLRWSRERTARDEARELLRRVKADRPTAHSDALWLDVCAFLASSEDTQ